MLRFGCLVDLPKRPVEAFYAKQIFQSRVRHTTASISVDPDVHFIAKNKTTKIGELRNAFIAVLA